MTDDETRSDALPEHETRDIERQAAGAGVLSSGGTAVDRGTGTLSGVAQGLAADEDEDDPIEDPVLGGNESLRTAQTASDLAGPDAIDPAR